MNNQINERHACTMRGSTLVVCKQDSLLIFDVHLFIKIILANKSCPMSAVLRAIFIATEHICTDISANSAPISVKYSDLHVLRTHESSVLIWRYLDQN